MIMDIGIYNINGHHIDTIALPEVPRAGEMLVLTSMVFVVKQVHWAPKRLPLVNLTVE